MLQLKTKRKAVVIFVALFSCLAGGPHASLGESAVHIFLFKFRRLDAL